jgi:hypothetical protein
MELKITLLIILTLLLLTFFILIHLMNPKKNYSKNTELEKTEPDYKKLENNYLNRFIPKNLNQIHNVKNKRTKKQIEHSIKLKEELISSNFKNFEKKETNLPHIKNLKSLVKSHERKKGIKLGDLVSLKRIENEQKIKELKKITK